MNNKTLIKFNLLLLSISVLSLESVSAQFNIRHRSNNIESRKEKIEFKSTNSQTLDLQVYNDAYDAYLRRLKFRKHNTIKLETSLTFNQNQFINWVAGGDNAVAVRAYIWAEHKYQRKVFSINTNISSAIGLQVIDRITTKNEDWLNISTSPNWRFANRWSFTGSLIIKTGMLNTYDNKNQLSSTFFAPGKILPTAGISYKSSSNKLDIYLAPLSGNMTFVTNVELANKGGLGIDTGKRFGAELGSFFRLIYGDSFGKNDWLTYNTKLESFIRYNASPTLWWENSLSVKLQKLLTAKLYVLTIYDDRIKTPDVKNGINNYWQINQSFGIGLAYTIQSKTYNEPPENLRTKVRDPKLQRKRWID